jgi:hypothetical protein
VDQVASDALGLPASSRALLVEKLLASLSGEADPSVEKSHLVEVRHRRAETAAGKAKLVEGDEALRRARAALKR